MSEAIQLECQIVNAEGQIKQGDTIRIVGKNVLDDQYAKAHEVLNIGGSEEILIDKKRNRFFNTKMLLEGESWAKQVAILP